MNQHILRFLEGPGKGVITVPEAGQLGCSPTVLKKLFRDDTLTRVAIGTYVSTAQLHTPVRDGKQLHDYALAEHQHLLRLDALLRLHGPKVAASHQSAVLAWGLPTAKSSLERIHLVHTKRGRTARRRETHSLHTCELDDVITRHKGRLVVIPALAVIGQAMEVGLVAGVGCMDAAIVAQHTTRSELSEMVEKLRHSPGLGLARRALELTDGLAESPGETRLRLVLIELGFSFRAQHWIRIGESATYYRVDFYLYELGVVLEYDGQGKYGEDRKAADSGKPRPAGSVNQALTDEKAREDDLRLDGFGVGRVTSSTLTAEKVRKIVTTAQRQAQPSAVHRPAEPPPWARAG
ncbi:hypothetical protein NF556_19590 [Ornithinimicrobium faecis]|uniref:DUF559 domain-containing protein n=1 Tax=Ornithinimicrobium faecis TaxID=2934158 RepID=A0ABY4YSR3_9MICO|nr:hypothetical protein [Ornithinimicrobium sp. HY1793]USQ79763.1 hypothetical protein NF556_19590 [Ornithinimicrobium sp. HY1793]